ncbi:hypothetical protein [Actinoallomurus sp. CA-142502]|uniref:hypothetical protein n=1 Tax=Actinoallomurus sp. CA-142502 TaxID=3239885 RepID=UPI003D89DDFE
MTEGDTEVIVGDRTPILIEVLSVAYYCDKRMSGAVHMVSVGLTLSSHSSKAAAYE